MITCKACGFKNLDGTRYCQKCGSHIKEALFSWKNTKAWPGLGQKGSSIAPLAAMNIENQAKEMEKNGRSRTPVRVVPLEDKSWYCPDCGEHNPAGSKFCKGCGRDF